MLYMKTEHEKGQGGTTFYSQCTKAKQSTQKERVKVVPGKRTPTHSPPPLPTPIPAKCTKAILLP